jgi:glycosyltransferase involved in cell wall biosynthesis
MKINSPRVSVCLPVYNGEKYVDQAVRSILNQTFVDFELVISDNCSTDQTSEICQAFAAEDRRVRYFRAEENRGLAWNLNKGFHLARGELVMWMHHDDLVESTYVLRCVEALDCDKQAVLCFANNRLIDENGMTIGEIELFNDGAAARPNERFKCIIRPNQRAEAIFGLMRREILSQTQLHGGFTGSDVILLAEMGLKGRFVLIPEFLFSRRLHALQASRYSRDARVRTINMDPRTKGKIILPQFRRTMEYLLAIKRAPISVKDQLACYKHVAEWIWMCRTNLLRDIVLEVEPRMRQLLPEALFEVIMLTKRLFFKQSWVDARDWEDK